MARYYYSLCKLKMLFMIEKKITTMLYDILPLFFREDVTQIYYRKKKMRNSDKQKVKNCRKREKDQPD